MQGNATNTPLRRRSALNLSQQHPATPAIEHLRVVSDYFIFYHVNL
jgi:hypothetical protein